MRAQLTFSAVWLLAACGGGGGAPPDAGVIDAHGPFAACDAAPVAPVCGCPISASTCVSLEVTDFVSGAPLGAGDAITAYLVAPDDYGAQPMVAIATEIPDADGHVVFSDAVAPTGEGVFVVLDDDPDAPDDAWAPTSIGPIDLTAGFRECVRLPAVSRAQGDVYFDDVGLGGDGIVAGSVILELGGVCGQPAVGVGIETSPAAVTGYFTADRTHATATGTTAASAALTFPARYCSPFCLDLTCSCTDADCGVRVEVGGLGNGFLFASMRCDAP